MSDSPAEPIVQAWCHQCHALLVRDQAQAGIVACERADCPWPGAAKRFAAASRRIRHAHFQSLDVTAPDSWKSQKRFLRADLFTLSFFVSEVYSLDSAGTVSAFWKTLFGSAKVGARFVYTDNGAYTFNDYFDDQWKKAGLQCLVRQTDARMPLRVVEEKSSLGEYLAKFGQMPRLQGTVTYRVLEKT